MPRATRSRRRSRRAQAIIDDAPPVFDFARYTEATITRRLYRDGTSNYFINKTPCRLRDITDFFLGTGVGTKAYAIIEQGRIGQIVSSRPQDRRAIIEEAAGITKFKAKKKAAEKKLDQTRQNLMRVQDIVSELDKRMGTLRRQAQKAERYRKYKGELRDIELWKATHRWLELNAETGLVNGRLGEARTELDDARVAWSAKDAHVVAERSELSVEERRLLGLQEHVYEGDNRIRLTESKIGFERREAEDLEARIELNRGEIATVTAQRETGAIELAQQESELAELGAEVEREQGEVASRDAAASEARQMLTNAQGRREEASRELGTCRTQIATADAQLESLARRRDEAQKRLERVAGEHEQLADRVKELDRESKKTSLALVELRQTRLDLGSQSEGFEARKELLADEVAAGETEVNNLNRDLQKRQSRLSSLSEIAERYEGFQRGTRAVMTQGGAEWSANLHGIVADVVRAPERLEIAVEAALGDRLGGVLVSDPGTGLAAIGFLKTGNNGRSAFVPLVDVLAPVAAPIVGFEGEGNPGTFAEREAVIAELATQLAPLSGEGVLGRMADLVAFADGFEAVGRRLLGSTIVVESLEAALALHATGIRDRIITVEGDAIDGDGTVSGGSRDAQGAGVLAQKREIRDLEEIVGRLEHELAEATAKLHTAKAELKQVTKALDGLRTQAHESALAIMGAEKDETRVRIELERYRDRLGQIATEQHELDMRLGQIVSDETVARERRVQADERIGVLDRAYVDLTAELVEHRDRLDELARVLTDAKIRAAQLGEKRAAAEAAALRLASTDRDLATRLTRLETEITESGERAAKLRTDCETLTLELESVRAKRLEDSTELETSRLAYDARLAALTEVELGSRDLRTRADSLSKEVGTLELKSGQLAMTRTVLEEGVGERYQLAVTSILHDFHLRAMITETEESRLSELKDLIDKMGTDINLTAIDEYAEVDKRFSFLSSQQIDLERAVDQLQKAIDKINKTSRKLFKDTFTAVNSTFKQVFPRLFRGGQAYLSLSGAGPDGESVPGGKEIDLLEAGVDIFAQPPGKKNVTVDQLSGGEKALTAVALVFSIFLIKPSPFCILDEVDAPLDEANVDRYNEIVREMTDRSQFIVISHNKRTMESADALYGVTMQEPGVSKLVSVNLTKIGARASTPQSASA